jgi:hypothetical protein
MFDQTLLKVGRNLLIFAFLIALPISFVLPFLGVLFVIVFSDAALVGISFVIASCIPYVSKVVRFGLVIVFWIVLSLILEVPRFFVQNMHYGSVGRFQILKSNSDATSQPLSISVEGISNPIVFAAGYPWEIETDLNVAGMRDSMGKSFDNNVNYLDFTDRLWRRGFTPVINGQDFPKLVISNIYDIKTSHLKLSYFDVSGNIVSTYERILPLPKVTRANSQNEIASDASKSNPINIIKSIFHDNFLRYFLLLNNSSSVSEDFEKFLDSATGIKKINSNKNGYVKPINFINEIVVESPIGESVGPLFKRLNTTGGKETISDQYPQLSDDLKPNVYKNIVCEKSITYYYVGDTNSRTRLKGLEEIKGSFPIFLDHVSNDGSIFTFYCDESTKRIFSLSQFGDKNDRFLKLQIFSQDGILQGKYFYTIPRWISRESFVKQDSLVFNNGDDVSFKLFEKIRWISNNNEQEDYKRYKEIELSSK